MRHEILSFREAEEVDFFPMAFSSCSFRGSWISTKHTGCLTSRFMGTVGPRTPLSYSATSVPLISSSGSRIRAGFQVRSSNVSSSQAEDERVDGDGGGGVRGGPSFVTMWEQAKQANRPEDRSRREQEFLSILQVPIEERDKVQRMQVVDRAAAALAAVNAFLADYPTSPRQSSPYSVSPPSPQDSTFLQNWIPTSSVQVKPHQLSWLQQESKDDLSSKAGFQGTPGPDFWSWVPPLAEDGSVPIPKLATEDSKPVPNVSEKDRTPATLLIPFETMAASETNKRKDLRVMLQNRAVPSLPPFQSLLEVEKENVAEKVVSEIEPPTQMPSIDTVTASAVKQEILIAENLPSGVHADGSRWWRETGVEHRALGVTCSWTVIRGVSADEGTEWEEKFWEASDSFDYKELGAEKSGRDSSGRVWRESWKEAMWQDAINGLQHIEKSAGKWGKDAESGQWREKWFEHYDGTGRTEKWADKWSQIDSNTPLEAGHAHTWRERWGENFDGQGGAMKYTDKWAERKDYDNQWTKWGDKWDEHFGCESRGVKQGETWWEGTYGEKWNRTWGEEHTGTGWVHKYGKSSSGEHWDTQVEEETWYERKPHFGFRECFENSPDLRAVNERKKRQL